MVLGDSSKTFHGQLATKPNHNKQQATTLVLTFVVVVPTATKPQQFLFCFVLVVLLPFLCCCFRRSLCCAAVAWNRPSTCEHSVLVNKSLSCSWQSLETAGIHFFFALTYFSVRKQFPLESLAVRKLSFGIIERKAERKAEVILSSDHGIIGGVAA